MFESSNIIEKYMYSVVVSWSVLYMSVRSSWFIVFFQVFYVLVDLLFSRSIYY